MRLLAELRRRLAAAESELADVRLVPGSQGGRMSREGRRRDVG
jgi:hypothetical protein